MPVFPGPIISPPSGDPIPDAPWLEHGTDFRRFPAAYCALIKGYCLEGNVENDFVVQNNKAQRPPLYCVESFFLLMWQIRQWYHAPWMHWSKKGREPLNGLTSELATPPGVIAANQKRYIQNWACGFYNTPGAAVFGKMWRDPNDPDWSGDVKFPLGTCVFKILLTDATEEEIMTLKGAPTMKGVIAPPGPTPDNAPDPTTRNDFHTDLRLLQVDFAVRDDRAPIGWVFGAFMYDGRKLNENPWDRLIPVGLMWGNSPELTQNEFEKGNKPTEQWLNPDAQKLMDILGGTKPSLGWNGRMNGPVDNFISACASCHSLAQKTGESRLVFKPPPVQLADGRWVPQNDASTMQWFRNTPAGMPFTLGATSGDYSLQLMIGWHNYQDWRNSNKSPVSKWWSGKKFYCGTLLGCRRVHRTPCDGEYP
ncbi:hypothetical protein EV426DRAFT_532203 [Tirmania nivea]|nr:hypothetical protein EV426DRAFT_532203 [Tirmania nivea]